MHIALYRYPDISLYLRVWLSHFIWHRLPLSVTVPFHRLRKLLQLNFKSCIVVTMVIYNLCNATFKWGMYFQYTMLVTRHLSSDLEIAKHWYFPNLNQRFVSFFRALNVSWTNHWLIQDTFCSIKTCDVRFTLIVAAILCYVTQEGYHCCVSIA